MVRQGFRAGRLKLKVYKYEIRDIQHIMYRIRFINTRFNVVIQHTLHMLQYNRFCVCVYIYICIGRAVVSQMAGKVESRYTR